MGTSTDAILFYGYALPEGDDPPWPVEDSDEETSYDSWEEVYIRRLGLDIPEDSWKERKKITDEVGCTIDIHCSYEYPMYFVAIKDTVQRAWRGNPITVKVSEPDEEWRKRLRDFCKIMRIDIKGLKPAWHLVSMWG